jgi:hypothetical protein
LGAGFLAAPLLADALALMLPFALALMLLFELAFILLVALHIPALPAALARHIEPLLF